MTAVYPLPHFTAGMPRVYTAADIGPAVLEGMRATCRKPRDQQMTERGVLTTDLGDGLTQYWVAHTGQGTHELPMRGHRYCALSYVASGGFNSSRMIKKSGRDWVLVTVDPVEPGG
jgi:hypothetical protein